MISKPKNVVVIGAGTMGSGIAAHLANIGFNVSLLDLTDDSTHEAFAKARKARPPHFYLADTAETIRLGSIANNLDWVREADWVCEAIIEKFEAKVGLYEKLEPLLRPDAYISTNTSGLEISRLVHNRSESFRRRFLGTHFFNPPRYLKLLELIPNPESDPDVIKSMTNFLENECARRVVLAKDTPGFIANRFGMWSMYFATHCAERLGLTIEQVDAITGPFIGRPKSGTFRLNDIVGLDIMEDIANNLIARCPQDSHTRNLIPPRSLQFLLEKGWIGDKTGQGYYRREGKELMSLDLHGLGYRIRLEPDLPSLKELGKKDLATRIREGLKLRDEVGEFLRAYLLPAIEYAEYLRKEISHNIEDFDRVMKWGFGWEAGPFEMADMIRDAEKPYYQGSHILDFDGEYQPRVSEDDYQTVANYPVIESQKTFDIHDMGDGVKLIATKTKMGVFTNELVSELAHFLENSSDEPIVLTSSSRSFSAGFDLQFLLDSAQEKKWDEIKNSLIALQQLGVALSKRRSVAAVFGFCLGGGFEMATSCAQVVALVESQIGLPESRVGLIPGGGGAAHMRQRHSSNAKMLTESAKLIIQGYVCANAEEACKYGFLRKDDKVVYHPDRLLTEAKRAALKVQPNPETDWPIIVGPAGGMIEQAMTDLMKLGEMTEHDRVVGEQLRHVFIKSTDFEQALTKERESFEVLLSHGLTLARIRHMLETGKPLRN